MAATLGVNEEVFWVVKAGDVDDLDAELKKHKVDVNVTNKTGRTLAHVAADFNHVDILKYLHTKGAKMDVRPKKTTRKGWRERRERGREGEGERAAGAKAEGGREGAAIGKRERNRYAKRWDVAWDLRLTRRSAPCPAAPRHTLVPALSAWGPRACDRAGITLESALGTAFLRALGIAFPRSLHTAFSCAIPRARAHPVPGVLWASHARAPRVCVRARSLWLVADARPSRHDPARQRGARGQHQVGRVPAQHRRQYGFPLSFPSANACSCTGLMPRRRARWVELTGVAPLEGGGHRPQGQAGRRDVAGGRGREGRDQEASPGAALVRSVFKGASREKRRLLTRSCGPVSLPTPYRCRPRIAADPVSLPISCRWHRGNVTRGRAAPRFAMTASDVSLREFFFSLPLCVRAYVPPSECIDRAQTGGGGAGGTPQKKEEEDRTRELHSVQIKVQGALGLLHVPQELVELLKRQLCVLTRPVLDDVCLG